MFPCSLVDTLLTMEVAHWTNEDKNILKREEEEEIKYTKPYVFMLRFGIQLSNACLFTSYYSVLWFLHGRKHGIGSVIEILSRHQSGSFNLRCLNHGRPERSYSVMISWLGQQHEKSSWLPQQQLAAKIWLAGLLSPRSLLINSKSKMREVKGDWYQPIWYILKIGSIYMDIVKDEHILIVRWWAKEPICLTPASAAWTAWADLLTPSAISLLSSKSINRITIWRIIYYSIHNSLKRTRKLNNWQ